MRRTTIPCPVCNTAVELRVFLRFWGAFSCHRCGAQGYGPVFKQKQDRPTKDGDIVIRKPRESNEKGQSSDSR